MWIDLAPFLATCLAIELTPGPNMAYIVLLSAQRGRAAGLLAACGVALGLLAIGMLAALGFAQVVRDTPWLYQALRWAGVAYLVYLGWKQWRAVPVPLAETNLSHPAGGRGALVLSGFLVNASNPKAIIFILAVLPQFLDPQQPQLPQYLLMALTMVAVDLLVMAGYTGLAARVLRVLRSPEQQRLLNRIFGGLFMVAAGLLAMVSRTG